MEWFLIRSDPESDEGAEWVDAFSDQNGPIGMPDQGTAKVMGRALMWRNRHVPGYRVRMTSSDTNITYEFGPPAIGESWDAYRFVGEIKVVEG